MQNTASALKDMILNEFFWLTDADLPFDFDEFIQNLGHFAEMNTCTGRKEESAWCAVRKCPRIRNDEVDNCLLCEMFADCDHTEYVRNRYSYLFDHVNTIQEKGLEVYLEEEEQKARNGVKLIDIRDY